MGGDISINITIVGAESTGKSTIVHKYTGRDYSKSIQHTKQMQAMTTMHSVKHTDNNFYELCIRDTCGSRLAHYRSLQLCHDADAVIITFNVHDSETFKRAKQWINDVTHNKTTLPIVMLVGTTRYPHTVLSTQATVEEANQIAEEKQLFYQTVCLSNTLEINQLFKTIIDTFMAPKLSEEASMSRKSSKSIAKNKNNDDSKHESPQKQRMQKQQKYVQQQKRKHAQKREHKEEAKQEQSVQRSLTKMMTLKALQSDPEALKIKIILLGDSAVGKTTFRRRLETDAFDPEVLATIGLDCSCFVAKKKHRGYSVEVTLMDPSGQEVFKNITRNYYRGVHGVILMCDISNIESWKNISFWRSEIEQNCNDDILVILVVNKMDLKQANEAMSSEIMNDVHSFQQMYHMKTFHISCMDKNEYTKYVRKAFEDLVADIIYDQQGLFERLKQEQGYQILKKLKGTFDKSESFITVDKRPYDINRGTIERTCACNSAGD